MIEYLIDTNIFIAVLKGNAKLKSLIESLACALDTTVYVELILRSEKQSGSSKNRRIFNAV
jgi:predicted nucleic acid-binding protein